MNELVRTLPKLESNEVYALDPRDVVQMQLSVARDRFEQVGRRVRAVSMLADDLGITAINELEDVIPLCLPHTTYKSYSVKHIEDERYDRLTEWLDGLTTHDLSGIDASACDSLESWLETIEAATPVEPIISGGTTGKISIFPRSTAEADVFISYFLQAVGGFADEPDSRLRQGERDWFSPIPLASGRQNFPRMFDLIRQRCYGGDGTHIHTLGQGHWDADLLWFTGRMRAAEARGELVEATLTPALRRLQERIQVIQQQAAQSTDQFLEELVVGHRGKPVMIFAPRGGLIGFAGLCRDRGLTPELGPGSFILTGGGSGSKGVEFPPDWEDTLYDVLPGPHQEMYGMTESTAVCRLCSAGCFHWPPTVAVFVLDPDSSQPLPRRGTQTGRLALFDLCPESYWGGTITGDQVTVQWEDGCACGRRGPRLTNNVTRYSRLRDDDKITCSKSADAYERAVDTLAGLA